MYIKGKEIVSNIYRCIPSIAPGKNPKKFADIMKRKSYEKIDLNEFQDQSVYTMAFSKK